MKETFPEEFVKKAFIGRNPSIVYDDFANVFQNAFSLPLDSIAEFYNSLLIDKGQTDVLKDDLLEVLNSFFNEGSSLQMRNIVAQLKNIDERSERG
jgi:hypothetical protein